MTSGSSGLGAFSTIKKNITEGIENEFGGHGHLTLNSNNVDAKPVKTLKEAQQWAQVILTKFMQEADDPDMKYPLFWIIGFASSISSHSLLASPV